MSATLVMLAVTKMQTGVCIAGVRRDDPAAWVRPVRDFGSILLGDVTYPPAPGAASTRMRRVMRPFDMVEFALGRARHEPPFIEDWTCDFAHHRPRLLGTLPAEERARLLDAAGCQPDALFIQGHRSLGALAVEHLTATFHHDTYSGKYEARLAFADLPASDAGAPCTDLKWRALGRHLLAEHPAVHMDPNGVRTLILADDELRAALGGVGRVWLALGLSRAYHGRAWPLVVGVHTLPDYEADVDYTIL